MSPMRIILVAAALALFGWLSWASAGGVYFNPRAELDERIERLTGDIATMQRAIDDHPRVSRALREYADRTLGGDRETVDHRLRSRLNRIGEEIKLEGLTVGTGRGRSLESPAKHRFRLRNQKALRDELDFVEVEGSISGEGTLEQVLMLIHRIESEPWLKRIHQVRLDPKGNGERFATTVRLTTLYLPGREPNRVLESSHDPAGFEQYESLVQRNPFRLPPPPAQAVTPAPMPGYPYGDWALTGVAGGAQGVEVWLLNRKTGESRRLSCGESLQELVLLSAAGEAAEFQLGDERFTVMVGQALALPRR